MPSDLSAVSEQKAPAQPSGMDVDEDDDDDAALKAALKMSTGASGSGEASSDAAGGGGSEAVAQVSGFTNRLPYRAYKPRHS